jgi:hypothetical protein
MVLSCILLFLMVLPCCAGQVTILSPQKQYYVLTGEEAALPLTLNNSYDHDITGVLRFSTVAEKEGSDATVTMQEKTFTLFTGQRSYFLPAGRSTDPLTLRGDIVFIYPDNGGRRATLQDIIIHFVKDYREVRTDPDLQESTDMPDPAAGSAGSMSVSGATAPPADPMQKVRNNQPGQDIAGLQQQLQREDSASLRQKRAFLSLVMQDPVIAAINRSLVRDGFDLAGTEVTPDTNVSGNFSLFYEKQDRTAVLLGSAESGSLRSADESSRGVVPLPGLLSENATFRSYERELAESGFALNASRMHYTQGAVTVNLTYADAGNRITRLHAAIAGGMVTGIERELPDQVPALLVPFLSVALVCLLFAAIVYLGRRLPRPPPPKGEIPGPEIIHSKYGKIAETMLDEADAMAEQGRYADAYARAGRALRFVLSNRMNDGRELSNEEVVSLLPPHDAGNDRITKTLIRCSRVAFAKGTPDPEEFAGIIAFIRDYLTSGEKRE